MENARISAALNEARAILEQTKVLTARISEREELLRDDVADVTAYKQKLTIASNTALLDNATQVIRRINDNAEVRLCLEHLIFFRNPKAEYWDSVQYVALANEPRPENDELSSHIGYDVLDGEQRFLRSYHIALVVPVRKKKVSWHDCYISYCENVRTSSINQDTWSICPPNFDGIGLLKPLLYLQTPETALRFLVQKFGIP